MQTFLSFSTLLITCLQKYVTAQIHQRFSQKISSTDVWQVPWYVSEWNYFVKIILNFVLNSVVSSYFQHILRIISNWLTFSVLFWLCYSAIKNLFFLKENHYQKCRTFNNITLSIKLIFAIHDSDINHGLNTAIHYSLEWLFLSKIHAAEESELCAVF